MTFTMDEVVYEGLMRVVGRGKISQFLKALAHPHVTDIAMNEGYRAMKRDQHRELEATKWINGLISDIAHPTQ